MPKLNDILKRGYFLRELPPPFVTYPFADVVTATPELPNAFGNSKVVTHLYRHDIPNIGIRRRMASLPNPISYFSLSNCLVSNWDELENHWSSSEISLSTPIESSTGRAIIRKNTPGQLRLFQARHRVFSKYILVTDISRCYGSIYTHSIPWALHSKQVAKNNKGDGLIGNVIDKHLRNGQDRQTIGIPIGPDSSLAIAEIVLSAFDTVLNKRRSNLRGFRYVDDFEFGFSNYADAEETLAIIRATLQDFELEINMQKTYIADLPLPVDKQWVSALRNFNFSIGRQATAFATYFDLTFELAREYPTDHVIKYAIQRIRNLEALQIEERNWEMIESFLLQCIMVETSTFWPSLNILMRASNMGLPVDLHTIEEVMNIQISDRALTRHGNEVAWALWAILFWELTVNREAAERISQLTDPLIALLALDAANEGLIPEGLDTTLWENYMNENELRDSRWLLAYEANIKGWLPNQSNQDFVAKDPAFGFLKENGVYFYEKTKVRSLPTGASTLDAPMFSHIG